MELTSAFNLTLDMVSDIDGEELSMTVDMSLDMESVVPTS